MSLTSVVLGGIRSVVQVPGDVLLAVGLLAFALAELATLPAVPRQVAVPAAVLMTLPLLWRRRAPVVVVGVVVGAFAVQTALGVPENAQLAAVAAMLAASYSVGAYAQLRPALGGLALALGLAGVTVPMNPQWSVSDLGFAGLVVGGAWGVGRLVRSRTAEARAHERRAARLAAGSEERARQAIEAERRRIARELHDIIAHSLSLMVIQAGAAEEVVTVHPNRAVEPLRAIQQTGREALADMKRLLGILRDSGEYDRLRPQPGLGNLDALIGQVRAAGVPVVLTVDGPASAVPMGVELSAYRIVQEALTNVLKHAGDAQAEVTVRYTEHYLQLEITDDGASAARRPGDGKGLAGMQERAELFGGELQAGPRPGGGFAVRARLPLDTAGSSR